MTIDEAIIKVEHYWLTGMDDYLTYDEIIELEEMLKELKERRELDKHVYDRLKAELIDDSRFLLSNYEAGYDDGIKRAMRIVESECDKDGKM